MNWRARSCAGSTPSTDSVDQCPALAVNTLGEARSFSELPKNARDYVRAVEERCGALISAIGVGPGRDQTLVLRDLLD